MSGLPIALLLSSNCVESHYRTANRLGKPALTPLGYSGIRTWRLYVPLLAVPNTQME